MPKLTLNSFPDPPDSAKNKKEIVRSIPVSESKRQACKAIQTNLMGAIEKQIKNEQDKAEAKRILAEKAAKPFENFRAQLRNPRIKRASKTKRKV